MLIQEKISGPATLLKLYVAGDEDLHALSRTCSAESCPVVRVGVRRP